MSKRVERLLKENNDMETGLSDRSATVMTDIVVYLRSANINAYYQETVRHDIMSMILEGERKGKDINDIIEGDYKQFCDDVIAELPKLSVGKRMLVTIRDALPAIITLLLIWLGFGFLQFLTGEMNPPYLSVSLGMILSGVFIIVIAFCLIYWISKHSFNIEHPNSIKALLMLCVIMLICIGLNIFITVPSFNIHYLVAVVSIGILFLIYKVMDLSID